MGIKRSYLNVIVLFAIIGSSYANFNVSCETGSKKFCTSKDCLQSAVMFIESMNRSVDPCDDFYEFACGNFAKVNGIPKTSNSNDRFAQLNDRVIKLVRDFLEKSYIDTEPFSVYKARMLYRSCIATDEMDAAGLTLLFQLLNKIGLPNFGFSNDNFSPANKNANLTTVLAGFKKHLNMDYWFRMSVVPDPTNRTVNQIFLGKMAGSNIFPFHKTTEKTRKMKSKLLHGMVNLKNEESHSNETELSGEWYWKTYRKFINSVLTEICKIHTNNSKIDFPHTLDQRIIDIVNLKIEFSNVNDEVYDTDDQLPIIMTVDEFQNFTNNITRSILPVKKQIIDWKLYFDVLFAEVENVSLDFEKDKIQVNNIGYFEALFKLIAKNRKKINYFYMWWQVVEELLPYTTNNLRFMQDTFYYKTMGLEHNPSRTVYCANAVNEMMGMAVSYLLVDDQPLDRYQPMMNEMMDNIHWAFEKTVNESNWMDETTKNKTILKAREMKTLVGYPEFIKSPDELDDYYYNYDIKANDYFGNVINYLQLDLNDTLAKLRNLNDYNATSWASDPLLVNSYNLIQANAITVPSGILRFPFFGHDLQVLNYGLLGSIVGHEVTHSFDNTGRKFDQDGNAIMWWTNQTIEEYENRSHCFVERYGSYSVPGSEEKVNGNLTLDENIADNGGLKEAFWAYRKFVIDHGEEPQLIGLENLNNEQTFFLAFANIWCEATSEESVADSLLDEHSPNHIRVNEVLINNEEFGKVWGCKKGSKMNPEAEKCKIW